MLFCLIENLRQKRHVTPEGAVRLS